MLKTIAAQTQNVPPPSFTEICPCWLGCTRRWDNAASLCWLGWSLRAIGVKRWSQTMISSPNNCFTCGSFFLLPPSLPPSFPLRPNRAHTVLGTQNKKQYIFCLPPPPPEGHRTGCIHSDYILVAQLVCWRSFLFGLSNAGWKITGTLDWFNLNLLLYKHSLSAKKGRDLNESGVHSAFKDMHICGWSQLKGIQPQTHSKPTNQLKALSSPS